MDDLSPVFTAGASEKQYVLGGDGRSDKVLLHMGRYLALDRSTGSDVMLDVQRPHAVLVSGKRGYGKSYTMGVLIEELLMLPVDVRMNIASVVIDTMGIFWTLSRGNEMEAAPLSQWGLEPAGFDIDIYVPVGSAESYCKRNIKVRPLSIPLSQFDGYQWCDLFGIGPISPVGVLIVRVIESLRQNGQCFSFDDVRDAIMEDERSDIISRGAADNYFRTAVSWGVFAEKGSYSEDIVKGGSLSVIDVSTIKNDAVRSAVVSFIARDIYHRRLEARRAHERMLMGENIAEKGIPVVWMFIDEAHQFVPANGSTLASDVLLNEWLRQGRQPGLSLVLATQRPSSLHPDVLSQSDIVVCHRLTSQDDILALESVRPTYMREHFGDSIRKMGTGRGIALIVDDTTETTHVVRIRPRLSWHGGAEQLADRL
ncbi:MAG: ATP-binding protein [Methanosarcinaceae archaeon]|nr:ATP-binding protein [Methanosarcinaceae archaeon]